VNANQFCGLDISSLLSVADEKQATSEVEESNEKVDEVENEKESETENLDRTQDSTLDGLRLDQTESEEE
jgi:hypothetical protein